MVTQRAFPSSRSAVATPVASTCPVIMWPPTRSPICSARSRFTSAPTASAAEDGAVEGLGHDVGGETVLGCGRDSEAGAVDGDALADPQIRETARRGAISMRPASRARISPSVSTMPLNNLVLLEPQRTQYPVTTRSWTGVVDG